MYQEKYCDYEFFMALLAIMPSLALQSRQFALFNNSIHICSKYHLSLSLSLSLSSFFLFSTIISNSLSLYYFHLSILSSALSLINLFFILILYLLVERNCITNFICMFFLWHWYNQIIFLLVANPCYAREPTCLCGRLKNNYIKSKIDYEIIPFHEFLLFQFNFCYDLIKKSLFECAISCENLPISFRY